MLDGEPIGVNAEATRAPRKIDVSPISKPLLDLPGDVRWIGLRTKEGYQVPVAGLFDLAVKEHKTIEGVTKFDYFTFIPFERITYPGRMDILKLQNIAGRDPYDETKEFHRVLASITGEFDWGGPNTESILEIIKNGSAQGKIPLVITGHGRADNSEWVIGTNRANLLETNAVVANLSSIVHQANDEVPNDLTERYSIVLLNSCNGAGITIPQSVIDSVSIPVAYTTDIQSPVASKPEDIILAMPSRRSGE